MKIWSVPIYGWSVYGHAPATRETPMSKHYLAGLKARLQALQRPCSSFKSGSTTRRTTMPLQLRSSLSWTLHGVTSNSWTHAWTHTCWKLPVLGRTSHITSRQNAQLPPVCPRGTRPTGQTARRSILTAMHALAHSPGSSRCLATGTNIIR
jgi:hypothetical protein